MQYKTYYVHSPFRISLIGGGTDFKQWYTHHKGGFISLASEYGTSIFAVLRAYDYRIGFGGEIWLGNEIEQIPFPYVKMVFKKYQLPPMSLFVASDLPTGSGVGSSASLLTGLLMLAHLIKEIPIVPDKLAYEAYTLEHDEIKVKCGIQDHWTSAHGGFMHVELSKESVKNDFIDFSHLKNHLTLVFTGITRNSHAFAKKTENSFSKLENVYHEMYQCIAPALENIRTNNIVEFGHILDEVWKMKQQYIDVSPEIYKMYKIGKNLGAYGGKLMGAGGGGFILFVGDESLNKKLHTIFSDKDIYPVEISPFGTRGTIL